MNPNDINVLMLESVAQRLGDDLLGELVFVGGAVAGLLIKFHPRLQLRRVWPIWVPRVIYNHPFTFRDSSTNHVAMARLIAVLTWLRSQV